MESKFWLTFFVVFLLASIVTTMKILYEGIKAADEETCREMLKAIARRAHYLIKNLTS